MAQYKSMNSLEARPFGTQGASYATMMLSTEPKIPRENFNSSSAVLTQEAKNIMSIQDMIDKKVGDKPFIVSKTDVKKVVSEVDHFPYTKFWRGQYKSDTPIVSQRDAGVLKPSEMVRESVSPISQSFKN